jgi:hypothetical protein
VMVKSEGSPLSSALSRSVVMFMLATMIMG